MHTGRDKSTVAIQLKRKEGRSNASGKQGWLKGSVKELTMVLKEGKERKNGGFARMLWKEGNKDGN